MPNYFGIDLGTTNTVVYKFSYYPGDEITSPSAILIQYPEDKIRNFYNVQGAYSLPSVLYVEPAQDGSSTVYVGAVAEQLARYNQYGEMFINTKRLMSKSANLGYGITPQEVAKELYSICLYSIDKILVKMTKKQKFCVTIPAAFNPFAEVKTIEIAKGFGYEDVSSLEEPKAAMLSFLFDRLEDPDFAQELLAKQQNKGGFLVLGVVDIGGGTTDVTIQRLVISGQHEADEEKSFATGYTLLFINEKVDGKTSRSNPYEAFGGLDFDRCAAEHLIQLLKEACFEQGISWDDLPQENISTLESLAMIQAKQFKENMTGNHEGIWNPPANLLRSKKDVTVRYTEENYQSWVKDLCANNVINPEDGRRKLSVSAFVEKTLADSGYRAEELDYVYVTGGMSLYDPIRSMLKKEFDEKTSLVFSPMPLVDVARGASLFDTYFHIIEDCSVLNEGIMLDNPCGLPFVIAKSRSPLPVAGIIEDKVKLTNPVEMHIDILQGSGPYDSSMRKIKTLWARETPPALTGTPVDVKYEITKERRINLTFIIKDNHTYEIPIDSEYFDVGAK